MFNTFRSRLASMAKTVASAFKAKRAVQTFVPQLVVTTIHADPVMRTAEPTIKRTPGAFGTSKPAGSKLHARFAKGRHAKARGY